MTHRAGSRRAGSFPLSHVGRVALALGVVGLLVPAVASSAWAQGGGVRVEIDGPRPAAPDAVGAVAPARAAGAEAAVAVDEAAGTGPTRAQRIAEARRCAENGYLAAAFQALDAVLAEAPGDTQARRLRIALLCARAREAGELADLGAACGEYALYVLARGGEHDPQALDLIATQALGAIARWGPPSGRAHAYVAALQARSAPDDAVMVEALAAVPLRGSVSTPPWTMGLLGVAALGRPGLEPLWERLRTSDGQWARVIGEAGLLRLGRAIDPEALASDPPNVEGPHGWGSPFDRVGQALAALTARSDHPRCLEAISRALETEASATHLLGWWRRFASVRTGQRVASRESMLGALHPAVLTLLRRERGGASPFAEEVNPSELADTVLLTEDETRRAAALARLAAAACEGELWDRYAVVQHLLRLPDAEATETLAGALDALPQPGDDGGQLRAGIGFELLRRGHPRGMAWALEALQRPPSGDDPFATAAQAFEAEALADDPRLLEHASRLIAEREQPQGLRLAAASFLATHDGDVAPQTRAAALSTIALSLAAGTGPGIGAPDGLDRAIGRIQVAARVARAIDGDPEGIGAPALADALRLRPDLSGVVDDQRGAALEQIVRASRAALSKDYEAHNVEVEPAGRSILLRLRADLAPERMDALAERLTKRPAEVRFYVEVARRDDEAIELPGREGVAPGGPLRLSPQPVLTAADIAHAERSAGSPRRPTIDFTCTGEGRKRLAAVTREARGRRLAIVVDGEVISAPTINTPITEGRGVIVGELADVEIERILNALNGGGASSVPIAVERLRGGADGDR